MTKWRNNKEWKVTQIWKVSLCDELVEHVSRLKQFVGNFINMHFINAYFMMMICH